MEYLKRKNHLRKFLKINQILNTEELSKTKGFNLALKPDVNNWVETCTYRDDVTHKKYPIRSKNTIFTSRDELLGFQKIQSEQKFNDKTEKQLERIKRKIDSNTNFSEEELLEIIKCLNDMKKIKNLRNLELIGKGKELWRIKSKSKKEQSSEDFEKSKKMIEKIKQKANKKLEMMNLVKFRQMMGSQERRQKIISQERTRNLKTLFKRRQSSRNVRATCFDQFDQYFNQCEKEIFLRLSHERNFNLHCDILKKI